MEHRVSLAGRNVRWLEAGEGGVVLLLHAFPLRAEMWEPQLASPPPGWRLVAPDLAGFGGADRGPAAVRGMDDYARHAIALLDHLGIEEAVVGGLSMGGYVTFALCRLARERVRAVVLADTRTDADNDQGRANRKAMLDSLDQEGIRAIARTMLPRLLAETTRRDRPEVVERVRMLIESNSPLAVADAIQALMSRPDSGPTLRSLECPVLLIAGRDDVLTPVQLHEQMQALHQRAELTVIEHAGHLSNLEGPAAFNAAIARFLTNLA